MPDTVGIVIQQVIPSVEPGCVLSSMGVGLAPEWTPTLQLIGTNNGVAAFGGDFYNHVLVAVGFNGNPLTQPHQVGVYSAIVANGHATGPGSFNAGFESAIGIGDDAGDLEKAACFAIGAIYKGDGSRIERTWGISTYDEHVGGWLDGAEQVGGNAAIAPYNAEFDGDWFIFYPWNRPNYLGEGHLKVSSEVMRPVGTSFMRLSGSNDAGLGANLALFGHSHSSHHNQASLTASGGFTVNANTTLNGTITTGGNLGLTGSVPCVGFTAYFTNGILTAIV